jgi:beta-lactamase superfamily II metal-dependent hydrolase
MNSTDAGSFKIHLLDVGTEKYGDCLVCELGNRRILIDGAHAGDYQHRGNRLSIPEQFEQLFGHGPPFKFDLLVVTHCHADHIGCLPTLVSQNTIQVATALVADEILGFGRSQDFQPPPPDGLTLADKLGAALREEDYSHLPDDELNAVLEDIASLESRYKEMLSTLQNGGCRVLRYKADNSHKAVENAFSDFGLKVLGPTQKHLEICSSAIAGLNDRSGNDVARSADGNLLSLYRTILGRADAAGAEDRPGKGAALNNQSIVIKLKVGSISVLLAGDMQFVKPETSNLSTLMKQLRQTVKSAGPYQFIKLTHHASYNGFDASLLQEWSPTNHFAHTGGLNDAGHPDPGVLELLDQNRNRLQWARTDRNGLITVTFPAQAPHFEIAFGELNDPTPNSDEVSLPVASGGTQTAPPISTRRVSTSTSELTAIAKIGPDVTRVSVTFDVERSSIPQRTDLPATAATRQPTSGITRSPKPGPTISVSQRLASGRSLPKLLFVTNRPRLENNIGATEAANAIQLIRNAGQVLYEVQTQASPWAEVRLQLQREDFKGVVILGGYDVLPSRRLDVLPPSLRSQIGAGSDSDNFIVWNDEAYGDKDGDLFPELPVSRVPDAKSPRLVMNALTAGIPSGTNGRFGVRNIARPFAAAHYSLLPGTASLLVSEPTSPGSIGAGKASANIVYFMLHGSDVDASTFWGEDAQGTVDAANITNVPQVLAGVVFAGCCWGALTVDKRASLAAPGQPLGIRTSGQSIALSYLHAGVRAFVGCTGTHYSPTVAPFHYFGGPMHSAFFKRLVAGSGPAQALFDARIEYASGMPHGQTSNVGQAIEYKIWKQFTCLGLGW